jgi:hypothetical protein
LENWGQYQHRQHGLRAHRESEAGSPLVALHDDPPGQNLHPTSQWRSGAVILDSFVGSIPAGTSPGTYPVLAGRYDSNTHQRVALAAADHALPDSRAIIAQLTLTAPYWQ